MKLRMVLALAATVAVLASVPARAAHAQRSIADGVPTTNITMARHEWWHNIVPYGSGSIIRNGPTLIRSGGSLMATMTTTITGMTASGGTDVIRDGSRHITLNGSVA